jgi:predicted aspartyl protease
MNLQKQGILSALVRNILLIVPLVFLSFTPGKEGKLPAGDFPLLLHTIRLPGTVIRSDFASGKAEVVVIPLKRVGKLFMIEARIDNETGNFLFDTGSSKLVLNRTYFRKLFNSDEESGGITGTAGSVGKTIVKRIQIPGMFYNNVTANVSDLGHIENRRGIKILGLFGITLLKDFEMVIDYGRNELYLYAIDKTGHRLSREQECRADMVQKIELHRDVMFIQANISGKPMHFCLDTGAESNVISTSAPKKVLSTLSILGRSDLTGSGRGNAEVLFCTMNDFTMGNRFLSGMNAILADLSDLSAYYGFPLDGMLGFDFFKQGRVIINLKNQELRVCLNKTARN